MFNKNNLKIFLVAVLTFVVLILITEFSN